MAKNLKKFVNLTFLKTIDLTLMRRLLERHETQLSGLDLSVFDQKPSEVRNALQNFFAGPEEGYPKGLTADLHRIAELASQNGLRLLLERASAAKVELIPKSETEDEGQHLNPKHVALRAFLDQPAVFNAASDFLAIETRSSLTEFSGPDENVDPEMNDATRESFEQEAKRLFVPDLMGGYCRIGWYDDDEELNIVVTHGEAIVIAETVDDGVEGLLTYRPVGHANLAYDAVEGRLKVGGIVKALRPKLAEVFAATVLNRPGFFSGDGSQDLYTLKPIERRGLSFVMDRSFDQGISRADIVEVEARKLPGEDAVEGSPSPWSVVMRDRHNALQRLSNVAPRVSFGPDGYELGYVLIAVSIETGRRQPVKRRVKVKPPHTADFKRHRFEGRITELLRRNRLCCDRKSGASAAAAE
jgi:hypothetical protein